MRALDKITAIVKHQIDLIEKAGTERALDSKEVENLNTLATVLIKVTEAQYKRPLQVPRKRDLGKNMRDDDLMKYAVETHNATVEAGSS